MSNQANNDEEVLAQLVRKAGDPRAEPDPQYVEKLRATILDRACPTEMVAHVTEGIRRAEASPIITVERIRHPQPEATRPTFFTRSLTTWRWIMRSPVSRVAAAVIFVLAIGGVALWFHGTGTTPAFADFLEPILNAKTVKYKMTVEMKGTPAGTSTTEVMMLDATRSRWESEVEMPNKSKFKTVQIRDDGQGKTLILDPAEKRATVYNMANMPKDKTPKDLDFVAGWRMLLLDARDKPDIKRESLGEKEIDGRRVIGFHIKLPDGVFSVWGDPKSGLPARIEATMAMAPNAKVTMSDFAFNVDMDESLFSVEPPAGYEVMQVQNPPIDNSPLEEKDLIEMFRYFSEMSGGTFPDLLDMGSLSQTAMMLNWTSDCLEQPQKSEAERQQKQNTTQVKLSRGLKFTVLLPKEADSHYAGKRVSLGAVDTPIFWYRPKDAKKYRVIYADLSVREAETPPSMPVAQPEQDLIDMFRECSELGGGTFPDTLDISSLIQMIMAKNISPRFTEKPYKPSAKHQETAEAQVKIHRGLTFIDLLPKEADSHYAGKRVSPGAVDAPIFWYRPKDAKQYRVIYADLSVRDADTPPSVPETPPEQDLIEAFREYGKLVDGAFPDSLDLKTMMAMVAEKNTIRIFLEMSTPEKGTLNEEQRHKIEELVHKMLHSPKLAPGKEVPNDENILNLLDWEKLAPGKENLNDEQKAKLMNDYMQKFLEAQMPKIMVASGRFQRGLTFANQLPPDADAHYAGKGISLGAADKPIFWYRPKVAKKYRVIYADLSVKEMSLEEAKKLSEAKPE